ncbi:pyruvate dehydrogenase E2 component (dihydrolipoamide acetyltransferase) [Cryobacterium mesophilum]|uniref:Dihydrolipoamide acetyltransferase component of pyruvate dehydrogenase complex n=1 Tax=Terrimesophilobacter mesophilus TaxID=433647 RepID=A0A4R8VEE8_9MICO|nr:dihydrolipoamide acetyltransferase family protein [Terrimesophilobacter mesophilus]MBB5633521.1 pyruvate dehydrogenase E2 component (dihydrolipoamide acetyltransferase) [Terrimesophilobacter mesophilus]TFB80227.1 2-oxo acid dehydrogenase subunit E2 [Terrimesophilobacter mesophilus]
MSEVVMPRLSDTMEEGELSKWLKNVGDTVAKGDVLAEIETDKATMDLEAFEAGVLEQQLVEAGAVVPIGTPVAVIGDGSGSAAKPAPAPAAEETAGASADAPAEAPAGVPAEKPSAEEPAASPAEEPSRTASASRSSEQAEQSSASSAGKPRTSPLARKIAKEHGIDLATLTGSGTQGRIVRADVEAAISAGTGSLAAPTPSAVAPAPAPLGADQQRADVRVPANRLRSVAAKRLTQSQAVPHFFLTSVVDVEKLLAFRGQVNEALASQNLKASINDVIVRAVAVALRQHPEANASWVDDADGQAVVQHGRVNVGIAVATEAGLLVPVIRDADRKSLGQIATETVALAEKARDGKLSLDEMTGGTFSVSNLGMFGIDQFTAVINPPEAAILAVGAASPVPALRDGVLVDVPKLKITLTIDHRVMDGAVAAGFLRDLVGILEQPLRMLL